MGTNGARLLVELEEVLDQVEAAGHPVVIVQKGQELDVDSYSAFFDNARRRETGLQSTFKKHGITDIDVVGLAFDYCVKATALDGVSLGFKTRVLLQGTRSVEPSLEAEVVSELEESGVVCVTNGI